MDHKAKVSMIIVSQCEKAVKDQVKRSAGGLEQLMRIHQRLDEDLVDSKVEVVERVVDGQVMVVERSYDTTHKLEQDKFVVR